MGDRRLNLHDVRDNLQRTWRHTGRPVHDRLGETGLSECVGDGVADLVEYTLDDGSTVLFESAEANLVALHGGDPDVKDGGRLAERLSAIAKTAGQVAAAMRDH